MLTNDVTQILSLELNYYSLCTSLIGGYRGQYFITSTQSNSFCSAVIVKLINYIFMKNTPEINWDNVMLYVKVKGYTYSLEDCKDFYIKYCNNEYISHTAKDVVQTVITCENRYVPRNAHLLEEEIECVIRLLDECKTPRFDIEGRPYSLMGRINIIQTNLLKCQSTLETIKLRAVHIDKDNGIHELCNIVLKETEPCTYTN